MANTAVHVGTLICFGFCRTTSRRPIRKQAVEASRHVAHCLSAFDRIRGAVQLVMFPDLSPMFRHTVCSVITAHDLTPVKRDD